MRTAEDIYSAAAALGMLQNAVWNGATAVRGEFRAASLDVFGVRTAGPQFACAVASLPDAAPGDVLDIGEQRYTISDREEDGLGSMTLTLHKQ